MTGRSNDPTKASPQQPVGLLESKKFADGLFRTLLGVCVGLLAVDWLYQPDHSHWHFEWEGYNGFHAAFGFVAYIAIVTSAKGLRRLVRKDEDYYGE